MLTVGPWIVPPAFADPFGGCYGPDGAQGCQADPTPHTYCYGVGYDVGLQDEADYAMNNSLEADTQMNAFYQATCNPGALTDAVWTDADLEGNVRGRYICTSLDLNSICRGSTIILDPAEINEGDNDWQDRYKTACHEAGHSVGLEHGENKTDCMINGEIPDTTIQWRRFSAHHINDHINPTY